MRTNTTSRPSRRRNAALIMKGGVYDGAADSHKPMDQACTREDTRTPGTTSRAACTPSTASTKPTRKNTADFAGSYSWSTAVRHDRGRPARGRAAGAPARRRRQARREPGSTTTRWCSTCTASSAAPASCCAISRACMKAVRALSRGRARAARIPAQRSLVHQADRARRPRLGRDRGDPRRALPLDRGRRRQDQELPDHRADHLECRAALGRRRSRADRGGADRHADRRSAPIRSKSVMSAGPTNSCLVCTVHAHDAQNRGGARAIPDRLIGNLCRSTLVA